MSHVARDEAFARYVRQTGMATEEQIEAARKLQSGSGEPLAEALVRLGALTPTQREAVEKRMDAQGITVIGGCRLVRKLGEGGMGAVYLAERTADGLKVALKILPKKHATDPEFLKRFRREAEAASALDHPNIARGLGAGEDRGYQYYLMEYCEGETLGRKLKRGSGLPLREAVDAALQVCRGLAYAHALGFVHRDIKPENVVVTPEGAVKILDLGLTKNLEDEGATFRTATGAAIGTPHYIAPEQARGDKGLDGRADLYALGATLYHLVTGRTPFSGSSVFEVINKHLTEQLPDPREIRPDIGEGLVRILRRLMAKRPDDRYPSAAEAGADLDRQLQDLPPLAVEIDSALTSIAARSGPLRAPGRSRRWIAAPAAALVLALLAAVLRPAPSPAPAPPPVPRRPSPDHVARVQPPPSSDARPREISGPGTEPEKPAPLPPQPAPKAETPDPPKPASPDLPGPSPDKPQPPAPAPTPAPAPPEPVPAPVPPPVPPPEPKRRPEPSPAALREAEKAFREPLKADYAKSSPSDRGALARRLAALPAPADPAQDYVRLRDARDLAAQGGEAAASLEAADRLSESFLLEPAATRADGLLQLAALRTLDAARAAAEACLRVAEDCIDADRYDPASRLLAKAESAAKDAKADDLSARAKARAREAAALGRERASLSAAFDTLKAKPGDPAANTAVGRFICLSKQDWPQGLPLLLKGADTTLRALAEKELADPADAAVQGELCEGWLAQADKERASPAKRDAALARARAWFDKAADRLTDADRTRLLKRLGPAPASPPSRTPDTLPLVRMPNGRMGVNVLALGDPARDAHNGAWQRNGTDLVSTPGGDNVNLGSVRIWFPYAPPQEEYELFLELERQAGQEDLVLAFPSPGGQMIAIGFDGWGAQGGCGAFRNGRWERLAQRRVFTTGRRHTVGIHVRRDQLRVRVDSQDVFTLTDYAGMTVPAHAAVPGRDSGIIVGAVRSRYVVRTLVANPLGQSQGRILAR